MQNFHVEIDALQRAQTQLDQYRIALEKYRDLAAGLANSVPKSSTPVRDPVADGLHRVFSDRAHTDGGVQGVLNHYLSELDKVQRLIATNLGAYSAADHEAADRYRTMPGEAR